MAITEACLQRSSFMANLITVEPKLLAHPWYQKWECGALPIESLRHYASEYYWQVANFPRYLSRVHSELEDLDDRQVILGNLADEENRASPHPELWLDFAESLGCDRESVKYGKPGTAARELVEKFRALVSEGPSSGLGAILAYESQVPEVAKFKSKALKQHYLSGQTAEDGARFFEVHATADVWHTRELEEVVGKLSPAERAKAQQAAHRAAGALWTFLDQMPH